MSLFASNKKSRQTHSSLPQVAPHPVVRCSQESLVAAFGTTMSRRSGAGSVGTKSAMTHHHSRTTVPQLRILGLLICIEYLHERRIGFRVCCNRLRGQIADGAGRLVDSSTVIRLHCLIQCVV